jgi:hypothetical protein
MVKLIFQEINKVRNIEAKPNFSDEVGRLGTPQTLWWDGTQTANPVSYLERGVG